jgi:hypothetical protein
MKNIKIATFNTGKSALYDGDILQKRVEYAKEIMKKVKSGEISSQEGTNLINEFGKKNKHWV